MKLPITTTNSTLYSDLSYKEFFKTYNPLVDGQAYIATYSFNHNNFDFWAKLEPLSVLYVHEKHKRDALNFLRRFPLFEVYIVRQLHTKAIFFSNSGRLLLGSENLYMPESTFSELMIEITIPNEQRDEVVKMAFRSLKGEILTCQYELSDIRLTQDGHPYLPCEKEVTYWDLVANIITPSGKPPNPEYHSPSYVYYLLEYNVNGETHVLAFNRGYVYCGDISVDCFKWLIENCEIVQYSEEDGISVSTASDLRETSPRKDYFFNYHPIASQHRATKAYWIAEVKQFNKLNNLVEPINLQDITKLKIRRTK